VNEFTPRFASMTGIVMGLFLLMFGVASSSTDKKRWLHCSYTITSVTFPGRTLPSSITIVFNPAQNTVETYDENSQTLKDTGWTVTSTKFRMHREAVQTDPGDSIAKGDVVVDRRTLSYGAVATNGTYSVQGLGHCSIIKPMEPDDATNKI